MAQYDILFLHPHRMINDAFRYSLFPMGFISMASLLKREGYTVKIVNLALEKALAGRHFDLRSFLKNFEFKMAAIDLHWWVHSYDSIELAKLCKRVNPNCLTVLGGFTASFFAKEILKRFPFIDVILKGEGEIPLLSLANNYFSGKSLREVPNSVVKKGRDIHENPITYVADSLDNFNFTEISLLHHWEEHFWLNAGPNDFNPARGDTVFSPWLCVARGCPYNCSFCGGTSEAQWRCAGRSKVTCRSPKKIVEDVAFLESIGIRVIHFSHGPAKIGENKYQELLRLLREENCDVGGFIELWQLPSTSMIQELAQSFSNLTLRIILTSGSEKVRQFNRSMSVSNTEFMKFIDCCLEAGISPHICFSSNAPLESRETFKETLNLIEKIILEKQVTDVFCGNYSLEPASPIYLHRDKYGIRSKIKGFRDYYDMLKKKQNVGPFGFTAPIGYQTRTLSEKEAGALIGEAYKKIGDATSQLKIRSNQYSFY